MKRFTILLLLLASLASCGKRDWKDASLPAADRAKLLLREMTLEERLATYPRDKVHLTRILTPLMRTLATRTWRTRFAEAK